VVIFDAIKKTNQSGKNMPVVAITQSLKCPPCVKSLKISGINRISELNTKPIHV
jgi:hypothetical protein